VPDGEGGTTVVDCLAYGGFTGGNRDFGAPLRIGPDNRSLARVDDTGTNGSDVNDSIPSGGGRKRRGAAFTSIVIGAGIRRVRLFAGPSWSSAPRAGSRRRCPSFRKGSGA
jgi:hypothetical protein